MLISSFYRSFTTCLTNILSVSEQVLLQVNLDLIHCICVYPITRMSFQTNELCSFSLENGNFNNTLIVKLFTERQHLIIPNIKVNFFIYVVTAGTGSVYNKKNILKTLYTYLLLEPDLPHIQHEIRLLIFRAVTKNAKF